MAKIIPKLNLNKIPQEVDNNSLIFAKNIRLNGVSLSSDLGFKKVSESNVSHGTIDWLQPGETIVGVIPYNTKCYLFIHSSKDYILCYDELTNSNYEIECNWNWSGGKIDGIATINLNGDILLSIAEYDVPNGKLVPFKVINTKESKLTDDESIYTQAPKVPFINLNCNEHYNNVIPAGTYQFFIRYEIRKDFYTHWFPASKELFAGCKKSLKTQQGGLSYIDTAIDSDFSFILDIEKPIEVSGYKSFQLGFILAHDDEVYARAYKHYSLDTSRIYFDYDTEYIEEILVENILESPYLLYNVGNVTSFKNKLYISNYEESNLNPELEQFAQTVKVSLAETTNVAVSTFEGRNIISENVDGKQYIKGVTLNNLDSEAYGNFTAYVPDLIEKALINNKNWILNYNDSDNQQATISVNQYGFKTNFEKTITKLVIANPDDGKINPDVIDNYIPDIFDEDDFGEIIPWEDELPKLRHYELTKYSTGTIKASDKIDDIIEFIKNNISKVSIITGKFVDDNSDDNVSFGLTYYITDVDGLTKNYYQIYIGISFAINKDNIKLSYSLDNQYTLVPHQGYYFYIHLVKDNGEATNGYLINTKNNDGVPEPIMIPEPSQMLALHDFPAIYPKFTFTKNLPKGYVACFISLAHVKNKVAHVFDITSDSTNGTLGSCLELDTQCYSWLNNMPVISKENTYNANYRASYDSDYLLTFGGAGHCVFDKELSEYGFICMPYEAKPEYIASTKCTPYIKYTIGNNNYVYDEYNALNLLGYLCRVKKPLKEKNLVRYFSGSDIYTKSNVQDETEKKYTIEVRPINDNDSNWSALYDSTEFTIYSNFNFNFVSLMDKITPRIVTKNIEESGTNKTKAYLLLCKDSSILSEIYELKSMYKSYTKKLYYPYDTYNTLVRFDNTIRSSVLEGDESKVNIYRFNHTDYYNVPTDKGIIVNLIAVGDNILVHTEDSIYKFNGHNFLTAQGGEDVQTKESEPFDTGIQELFGSEYGYAGLRSKEHQILSEFGYTFWDADTMRIYLYTGNAQIKVLSDDISKLLKHKPISNIYFADDYYNNRIFICILFADESTVTLSYDFVAKSFISTHDFKFDFAFKTKTNCYFVYNSYSVYVISDKIGSYLELRTDTDSIYPKYNNEDCVIDVIYNDQFETIKTCNVLSWVCNKILAFAETPNKDNIKSLLVAEEYFENKEYETKYKGEYLRIYTDSCATDLINISGRSNDSLLSKAESYKNVRYNQGKWTFNYFRNILNRNHINIKSRSYAQEDTLIYGKYIVARFVFSRTVNFKFEDVSFNINNDNNI